MHAENRAARLVEIWWRENKNKLVEWKALVDTVEIKSADLKDTFFVLEFCGFPNCLDVRERSQTSISCFELFGRLKCQAADKGGAVVLWRADLYQKEALRQPSDNYYYAKVNKDPTFINQNIVKNTINDLLVKQELPATAKNLTITTPRPSCIYYLPKIHKPIKPGRPIDLSI